MTGNAVSQRKGKVGSFIVLLSQLKKGLQSSLLCQHGTWLKVLRVPFAFAGLLQAKELGLQVFHAGTTLKDGRVVTSGGRVLSITAVKEDLMKALGEANRGVAAIRFKGATYRKDIGHRGIRLLKQSLYVSKGTSRNRCQSKALSDVIVCVISGGL